jgi:membrane protein YqaA with SNARE-associated domain
MVMPLAPTRRVAANDPGHRPPSANAVKRRRSLIVAAEGALVLGLLLVWLLSPAIRESKSLAVLFFYAFPSEFLVGLLPHEPVLIYFGAFRAAWVVALVSAVGTVGAEAINYSFCSYFYERPALQAVSRQRLVRKTIELFERAPFAAILFAGFTPAPFFPVRFLVVMAPYPRWKYLLGVALSRTPRFFLLAVFGAWFHISGSLLLLLFVVMFAGVNVPALFHLLSGPRTPARRGRALPEAEGGD